MNTVKIYRLNNLSLRQYQRLREAQQEAALVWNECMALHRDARIHHLQWPGRDALQNATKGRFALYSQSVQMVTHAFLANIETTRQRRLTNPRTRIRYPYKEKRFYPVSWPAQSVHKEEGRVVLPMGRGRDSLVLPIELPEHSRSVRVVWNHGYELHVSVDIPQAEGSPGEAHATVDLGETHLASVTTNTSQALIVTGRGIRSLKRHRAKALRTISKKQARCTKHSRRWKKLHRAKNKQVQRAERRIRDQRHQATRKVITFCLEQKVGTLFIGNPHWRGNHSNSRRQGLLCSWEYDKDISYLTHKSKQAHIECFTGSERGTSCQCPDCGHKHKPKKRQWMCKVCGFAGHRDLVASVNMHKIAFAEQVNFPRSFTYLRPAKSRKRSSRADTPPSCLSQSGPHPHVADVVSSETGYRPDGAEEPVSL